MTLTLSSLGLANFFSTEFEGAPREASNAEAQPAFPLHHLVVPWSTKVLLYSGVVVPNILSL
jgi:hypothetical protein